MGTATGMALSKFFTTSKVYNGIIPELKKKLKSKKYSKDYKAAIKDTINILKEYF
jgi:hypothetical protein